VRKVVETLWGTISGLRVPRVWGAEGEVRLFGRYERRLAVLGEQLVMGFGQGMRLRLLRVWLNGLGRPRASAPTLAAAIQEKAGELRERRSGRLPWGRYRALVVDGVWAKRRGGGKQVLLVAVVVRADGGFEVLDREACAAESAPAYERLLSALYERGLETVELIAADEAGAIASAAEMVHPRALRQVCLYHLQRTLER
jgi:transposase-like protein